MARSYYALVAGLPDLLLDDTRLQLSRVHFRDEIREQMPEDDFRLIETLFYPFDNANLIEISEKGEEDAELDPRGNFSREMLAEELKSPDRLPAYMVSFLEEERQSSGIGSLSKADKLSGYFYRWVTGHPNRFLREWFTFEQQLRNVLAALNCRKLDLDVDKHLVGDDHVTESIRKSNTGDFGLGRELPWLEKVSTLFNGADISAREFGLDLLRWEQVDEMITFDYFTVERIAGFIVQLGLAERWLQLDEEKGQEMFRRILDGLLSSFEFPEQFSVSGGRTHGD